mgnify:CR=1 FL=1
MRLVKPSDAGVVDIHVSLIGIRAPTLVRLPKTGEKSNANRQKEKISALPSTFSLAFETGE